jgi:UDP-glucose 4-epimerase
MNEDMQESVAMRWLITGGCGFIGTSLVSRLLRDDPECGIRVLDNLLVGTGDDLAEVAEFSEKKRGSIDGGPSGIELVVGDVRDFDDCRLCVQGIDIVVHLAASTGVAPSVEEPRFDMESNVTGTFNMLEAARLGGAERFVFASSGAPVGEVEPPIHEEKAPRPVSPYGASKLAGEGYCSAYFRTFGLKTVSLRFGNVYGPRSGRKNSVVAKFFKEAAAGKTLEIYGDGDQTRDFLFIDDLLEAILCASSADIGGEIFQIATHRETTVNEIAALIRDIVRQKSGKDVNISHGQWRQGDVKRNYSDISKARTKLGWEPRHELKSGLEKTYGYFYPESD